MVEAEKGHPTEDTVHFRKELAWREFSWHLLFHYPDLASKEFNSRFTDFGWDFDERAFRAWTRGITGYPIVDAGMRELWQTGWMHNRVRMIAASFLIKDLMIDWRHGEQWFRDTLVDADPASNAASWQWVAGSGADAAPYFRIFNPVLQGEKFDRRAIISGATCRRSLGSAMMRSKAVRGQQGGPRQGGNPSGLHLPAPHGRPWRRARPGAQGL